MGMLGICWMNMKYLNSLACIFYEDTIMYSKWSELPQFLVSNKFNAVSKLLLPNS